MYNSGTIMRFEVPQFIEIEDKIFGPFTWKQFVYLMGGAGIAVVLFLTTNFIVFVLLGLPIAGLAFLLAFYPVNNRPFSVFLEAALQYFSTSRLYLWRKKTDVLYNNEDTGNTPIASYVPPTSGSNIHSLSRKLELQALQQEK